MGKLNWKMYRRGLLLVLVLAIGGMIWFCYEHINKSEHPKGATLVMETSELEEILE